jgi:two-component system, NtrC family, nitrogen regulation sensor histidine kinase NtrY
MSLRRKLLIVMAATVILAVGAVAWVVALRTRKAFERSEAERTAALVAQFRREYENRGQDVVSRIEGVAESETAQRMALELSHGTDASVFLTEARPLADSHRLEFLEFFAPDGTIISSAQSPARFGYKETIPPGEPPKAFLKLEELPNGSALGVFALRAAYAGQQPVYVLGGERIDAYFLSSLALPTNTKVVLYRNTGAGFSPDSMIASADLRRPEKLSALIEKVRSTGQEASENIFWTSKSQDSDTFQGIPLEDESGSLLGVLLIGSSRRNLVDLQHQIRATGFIVAGAGIILAILVSGWVAARVTRPVEELAAAATDVAAGNWTRHVEINSADEIGELADAFNRMTRELTEQRDRLVQSERVAAWRELARRLAHELKNPLFPLQITVENLLRSRGTEHFDEVFRESTSTLMAELTNLKTIIGRFSDFSKMPQPQLQPVQVNDIIRHIIALHEPQFNVDGRPPIVPSVSLDASLPEIDADPDLLHRVISNLVLNAMDAMPDGGTLGLRTADTGERIQIDVSDTGTGLTPEETARLFTPYYTTKQHGTGLGLAIVQSVISDHRGSITVESAPGKGATFHIELPKRAVTNLSDSATAANRIS